VADIEARSLGRVWIEGGGRLLAGLMRLGKLDVAELAVIPVVLGEGIPAFPEGTPPTWLRLESAKPWLGDALWLIYRRA
jgi:dihydrofolate reductase